MRVTRLRFLFAIAALLAGVVLPGTADPAAMRYVADVQGRCRIAFPAGWKVSTPSSDAPAVQGVDVRTGPPYLNVNVVIEPLPEALTAADYAHKSKPLMAAMLHGFALLQEGPAQIAHRASYYRYYTWESNDGRELYQVQAYFTMGRLGFVLTGTTVNDPSRIRADMAVVSQIFETFTPGAK